MRKTDRPNIVFIMADQFRHDWLGCAGNAHVKTPNIDKLASRGVRFSHAFTNSPICAAARIGLATLMQPFRVGALDNMNFLPLSARTYYQQLRDAECYVGCVGKLDLGKPDPYNGANGDRPATYSWGFTHPVECEGKMHAGLSPTPIGPYTTELDKHGLLQTFHEDYQSRQRAGWFVACDDSVLPRDLHEDGYIGRRSEQWLRDIPRDFPFHLFVSFVGPHDPFDPPKDYADQYRNADMPAPISAVDENANKPGWIHRRNTYGRNKGVDEKQIELARRQYSAAVTLIDDAVGGIIETLEAQGLAENTYVVFTSDHGEMLGDHGLYTKHCAYESSWRIPLVVAGPGIAGGRTSDALVELIDVGATACDLLGVDVMPNVDARSFAPLLRGQTQSHRENVFTMERNYSALRTQQWKVIESFNDGIELYNMDADPTEQHNVAAEEVDTVKTLRSQVRQRMTEGKWNR